MLDANLIIGPWKYRQFIFTTVKNEYKSRFIRSKLGFLWMILNPLATVLILSFILSSVLSAKLPGIQNKYSYSIYLMAGTLGWTLFSETLTRCMTIFVENGSLMKKIVFPKICLPIIAIITVLINNFLLFIAIVFVFAFLGHFPNFYYLWLPPIILITIMLGAGLGLVLGILNVFIRDVAQITPIVLQFLFWLTPIVYMPAVIPENFQKFLNINPVYGLIASFQNIMLFGINPLQDILYYPVILSLILLALFYFIFFKANEEMVDVL
jgi:lipopolysaccharide transport system permease protein